MSKPKAAVDRIKYSLADRRIRQQVDRVETWLRRQRPVRSGEPPVMFFNASTRIHHLSLNGAFSLLAAWAVRTTGIPVRYLVCRRGMQQCVLGTNADRPEQPPPCNVCLRYSQGLFPDELSVGITLDERSAGTDEAELGGASLGQLMQWEADGLPFGRLCLPSLRWALRRHDLVDDGPTRTVFRQYLVSAHSLANRLDLVFEQDQPRALVVFNGVMYPEAVARAVARNRAIPTVTHEVGLKPNSSFFSHADATFREVSPTDLTPAQDQELDQYLDLRRKGRFSMAGIRFWPEVRPLPEQVSEQLAGGRDLVTVFTNVVFDTSQVHANTLYEHMFAWLDDVSQAVRSHPETLFVVRTHPDENRPGKASRQAVADWFEASELANLSNAMLVSPEEHVSSYELIERSKFVMVYNSSVGLEASILGVPVLCAGRARYTQVDTVEFPDSANAYRQRLEDWLQADEIEVPARRRSNSRAFLYHELNHASLDLGDFLDPYPILPGMVELSDFEPAKLAESVELGVIATGILERSPFALEVALQMEPA